MSGWVLVAGGSGAIGSEVCRELARAGWDVALTYNRNAEAAEQVRGEVTALGREAATVQVELTDSKRVAEAVTTCAGTGNALSGVVYAAGPFFKMEFISKLSSLRFAEQVQQDTVAAYNVLQPAIAPLRETGGCMVALCTSANRRYLVSDLLSTAPKAGIEAIVKGIAAEEARNGIRANGVGVGVVDAGIWTRMADELEWSEERLEAARRAIPLGRLGLPSDIATAVEFLMSDRASFITGQILDVDGGHGV